MTDLTQAREAIDALDTEITALLSRRFKVVDAVSDYKAKNGLAVYDPAREKQIIARLESSCGADYQHDIAEVYRRLFEISRRRQERRRACAD